MKPRRETVEAAELEKALRVRALVHSGENGWTFVKLARWRLERRLGRDTYAVARCVASQAENGRPIARTFDVDVRLW